ncbi:MAG: hypothetical protein ABI584_06355 [Acidobacteriota bacterium]
MEPPGTGGRKALLSAASIAAILAVFVLVRLPLLTKEGSARGWNGDSAIFGLMAKKIHDGKGFDVFFWGQNYMGPLTPALAAGIRRTVLDPAGLGAEGGPIALRLASMSQIAFGISLFVLAFTRLFGRAIAALAGLWVAIGPPFFIRLSALNRSTAGPEMSFFLGSVLFLLAAGALTRPRCLLDRRAGLFVLGLVAGVGWWMNQTIVFVLLPVLALVFLRSTPSWRGWTRLLTPVLCGGALGYSPVWLGRLLGWYEPAEGPYITPWVSSGLAPRIVRFLGKDSWRVIGLDGLAPPPLLAAVAVVLLSLLIVRQARRPSSSLRTEGHRFDGLDLVGAVVVLGGAVSFLKNFDPAGDRYLAPVLPAAVAFLLVSVVEGANLLRRRIPSALVTLALGGLALAATLFLWRQGRGVVEGLLLEPDPRAPLEAIAEEGYTVCHASYDTAYVLQFLSDERVRFIPYHSVDRNRTLSAELRSIPGPQCLVTNDGLVRRWLPSDAADEGGPVRHRAETR